MTSAAMTNDIAYHPLADLFPMLRHDDLNQLADDIQRNGLLEPIWLYEGKILDGRNRYAACRRIGLEPQFRQYTGDCPAMFVWSLNGERRHLTASQRAAIAVELIPWLEKESKQGQRTDLAREQQLLSENGQKLDEKKPAGTARKAAKELGVNHNYVFDAKRLKEESPEDFEEIKAGKKTIGQAKKERQPPAKTVGEDVPIEPVVPQSRGKGLRYAHEAIAVLKRIPLDDGLRQEAFDIVIKWIKTNRG